MSWTQTIFAVLVLDIILVPPVMIIAVASNLLWIKSMASKMGRLGMPFIFVAAFSLASACGYLLIAGDQTQKESAATYEESTGRDDCERHPGPYGC